MLLLIVFIIFIKISTLRRVQVYEDKFKKISLQAIDALLGLEQQLQIIYSYFLLVLSREQLSETILGVSD